MTLTERQYLDRALFWIVAILVVLAVARCQEARVEPAVAVEQGRMWTPPHPPALGGQTAGLVAILADTTPPPRRDAAPHLWRIAETIQGTVGWYNRWEGWHVDPVIIASIIRHESGGDSAAVGAVGEIGLGQIRPELWLGTWPECGDNLYRIRDNVCYTIRIWRWNKTRRGTLREAALAYNGCHELWPCADVYPARVLQN